MGFKASVKAEQLGQQILREFDASINMQLGEKKNPPAVVEALKIAREKLEEIIANALQDQWV